MDTDLTRLTFPAAMSLALGQSRLSRDDVATAMGWSPSQAYRFFNEGDNYWPSLPSVPRLCSVLGNTIILQWMSANACCLGVTRAATLEPESFVLGLGRLFKEMGDVAEVGSVAISDGKITRDEAKKLMKELRDVAVELMDLMASTEMVQ